MSEKQYHSWYRLIWFYLLALLIPPALVFFAASSDYIAFSLLQLLGIVGIVTSFFLLFPISLTLNRLHSDQRLLAETFSSFVDMMDNAVDMIFIRNHRGQIIEVNQQASDYLGYKRKELLSMDIQDLEKNTHFSESFDPAEKAWNYETEFITKTGNTIPVELRTRRAQWIDSGNYVVMARDISNWKQTRERLKASTESLKQVRNKLEDRIQSRTIELEREVKVRAMAEDELRKIRAFLFNMIDSMPSMIIALNANLKVTQWNKMTTRVTGISSDEAKGQRLDSLIPNFATEINQMAFDIYTSHKDLNNIERLSGTINGQKYLFDVMAYPLQDNHYFGVVIRIDDVTERVKMENIIVQSEKMLSLGGLAAGMAHEINNPLGAILQSSQNLQRRLFGKLPRNKQLINDLSLDEDKLYQYLEKQQIEKFVTGISRSGERAAELVRDMLAFSRPTKGTNEAINLVDALESALRLADSEFSHNKKTDFRKIKIEKNYTTTPLKIAARENQLEQVFLNILLNAAQAMSQNAGDRQPTISINVLKEENRGLVRISDNGPGMSDSVKKRIFEPFFSTKNSGQGTGLGLSISYFIINQQLDGQLSVSSEKEKGCSFTIRLPLIVNLEAIGTTQDNEEQIELPL